MNGLVTIAFGEEYDRIAAHTMLYSAKMILGDTSVCVITNIADEERDPAWQEAAQLCDINFIYGEGWPQHDNRKYKMQMWDLSPFDKTIFIDADAVIQKPGIECIFAMLDLADFVLNGLYDWRVGQKIPKIYVKGMLACGAKLPIRVYNGGFLAWRKGEVASKVFEVWNEYWKLTGKGRDMPALACAIQHEKPLLFDAGRFPVFAPSAKDENCIVQHNYNDTFLKDFDLPKFQESKPFDSDPTDFSFVDFDQFKKEQDSA